MSKRKPRQGNNLHLLDGQQRAELGKFGKDLRDAMPHMVEMATTAKALHKAMIEAPFWTIQDAPKPTDEEVGESEVWTVGHAKVNYVKPEDIKTEGAQDK